MFKAGRNEPCPCGSGKKYKSCCWVKDSSGKKSFKAKVLSNIKPQQKEETNEEQTQTPEPKIDLMQRAFGNKINPKKEECGPDCSHEH
jgi:hypothetical protein